MTVRIFGEADAATLAQAERCAIEAEAMLLMAGNHKGYGMPVGGLAVYKDKVSPAGVGFDIACGNKAVRTDLRLAGIENRLSVFAGEKTEPRAFADAAQHHHSENTNGRRRPCLDYLLGRYGLWQLGRARERLEGRLGSLHSHWAQARGLEMHARVSAGPTRDNRPAVVLVHGLGVSSRYMLPFAEHLALHLRVYGPDLPGFGLSEKPREAPTIRELADYLAAWMGPCRPAASRPRRQFVRL